MSFLTRHRPTVQRGSDGAFVIYQMRCTCGQTGEAHSLRSLAVRDLDRHVAALPPVPEHQRCRSPHAHDRREWEVCEVCQGQLCLPLEEQ